MRAKKQLWARLYGITPEDKVGCLYVYRQGTTWSIETSSAGGRFVHPGSTYLSEAGLIWNYSEIQEVRPQFFGNDLEKEIKAELEEKTAERAEMGARQ